MKPRLARTLMIGGFAVLLAGCGQRGALYLPDQQPREVVTTPPATAAPATGAPEEDEETAARRSDAPAPAGN